MIDYTRIIINFEKEVMTYRFTNDIDKSDLDIPGLFETFRNDQTMIDQLRMLSLDTVEVPTEYDRDGKFSPDLMKVAAEDAVLLAVRRIQNAKAAIVDGVTQAAGRVMTEDEEIILFSNEDTAATGTVDPSPPEPDTEDDPPEEEPII